MVEAGVQPAAVVALQSHKPVIQMGWTTLPAAVVVGLMTRRPYLLTAEADAVGQLAEAHATPLMVGIDARSWVKHCHRLQAEYHVRALCGQPCTQG
jgi:hypothetical protein